MSFRSQSLSSESLEMATEFALKAIDKVAAKLKDNFGESDFTTKNDEQDWVTHWDTWAERIIKKELAKFSLEIGVLAEESGKDTSSSVYWTVDPIDGTAHFVRGNKFCTTMIALVDHGIPVLGVINDFVQGDIYSAILGRGAYKNLTQKLQVSNRTIPYSLLEVYSDKNVETESGFKKRIEATGARISNNYASGYAATSVARGSIEGFAFVGNSSATEWDIAPGAILIHEAGGSVRNVGENDFNLSNFDFIAANRSVCSSLEELALAKETHQFTV